MINLTKDGINETKAEEHLRQSIEFFYNNGHLPEYNSKNKEEMKLYDFLRKIDFKKYYFDSTLIAEYERVYKINEREKPKRKKQKHIKRVREGISIAINNYYNFYLEYGRFPSDSKCAGKEERRISKAYTRILNKENSKYHTKKHKNMIQNINNIKKEIIIKSKLGVIKEYVDFYEDHNKTRPRRKDGTNNYDKKVDGKETQIAIKMSRLNLEEIEVPRDLKERLDAIESMEDEKSRKIKIKANGYMEKIILFMKENQGTPYERNLRQMKITYNGKEITAQSALKYVDKNINFVDDELLEIYNGFSFVKAPKQKDRNDNELKYIDQDEDVIKSRINSV